MKTLRVGALVILVLSMGLVALGKDSYLAGIGSLAAGFLFGQSLK